jgi:hypothetical protein
MNECCKKNIRAAAETVAGAIPDPISVVCAAGGNKQKAIDSLKPLVSVLFHVRDKILKMIPEDGQDDTHRGPC